MIKKTLLVLMGFFVGTTLCANDFPQKARLENGQSINIYANRTWEYEKILNVTNTKESLVVSSINVEISQDEYIGSTASLSFSLTNNFKKDIAAVNLSFEIIDAFGNSESGGGLSFDQIISSGESQTAEYQYSSVGSISTFYSLKDISIGKTTKKIVIKPTKIAFIDGQIIDLKKQKK